MPQNLWGGPSLVCMARRGCQSWHDPTAGGLAGGNESWAEAKAGCALAEIPVIWGFFFAFWAPAMFWLFPSGFRSSSSGKEGTPWEGQLFFSPFLGVDARSEQQNAAETEADKEGITWHPPACFWGAPAGHGSAGAPQQEALAPILSSSWRRMEEQHQHGAAPTGNEHHPLPASPHWGQTIPGHGPWRILWDCPPLRTPTLLTSKLDVVAQDKPCPPAAL